MDRTKAPPINEIQTITLPKVDSAILTNGIKVFYVIDKSVEAFKIEAVTQGGFFYSESAAQAILSNKMILEGTKLFPGNSLIAEVDRLGSFLEATPSFDYSSITLFGLTRFFEQNLSIFYEALTQASFENQHLEALKRKELDRLKLNQEKGSYQASINLRKSLFTNHPYGYTLNVNDINDASAESLKLFYQRSINSFNLFLSGNIPIDFLNQLEMLFSESPTQSISPNREVHLSFRRNDSIVRDERFIQSSIRLGKILFNRSSEDYLDFLLLNEILGGYFGSRLMKNIREEKGYTYGISSQLYALKETGYFTIGTDVNSEAEEDTLVQIRAEIDKLQNELISEEELYVVKNYLLGSLTNSLSTPFATIDKFKVLYHQGFDLNFYDSYIQSIKSAKAEKLLDLANKYLDWDSLSHSIVGS